MEEKISELVVVIYLGKNWWGSPSFVRCWPVWMIESLVCHSGAAWWWGDVTLGLSKGAGMVSLSIDWTHSLCSTRQATYFRVARGSHLQLYSCCFVPRRVMSRPHCTQLANPAVSLVIPFVSLTEFIGENFSIFIYPCGQYRVIFQVFHSLRMSCSYHICNCNLVCKWNS